jgi:hypothetical protein
MILYETVQRVYNILHHYNYCQNSEKTIFMEGFFLVIDYQCISVYSTILAGIRKKYFWQTDPVCENKLTTYL